MRKMKVVPCIKNLLLGGAIFSLFVVIASIVFDLTLFWAVLLVLGLCLLGEFGTGDAYLPGNVDNPDGEALHPYWVFAILLLAIIVVFVIGELYPYIREIDVFR